MTPERAQAYRRVLGTLSELGPAKLQPGEQEVIREAVDSLLFAHDLDETAQAALADAGRLGRALVESGRWEPATAQRLVDDVSACGPAAQVPELRAA
jgi:hypothetical protein